MLIKILVILLILGVLCLILDALYINKTYFFTLLALVALPSLIYALFSLWWYHRKGKKSPPPPPKPPEDLFTFKNMSDQQAYDILGISPTASDDDIIEAHRRLLMKIHPDQGGSAFLTIMVNKAKEQLLKNN